MVSPLVGVTKEGIYLKKRFFIKWCHPITDENYLISILGAEKEGSLDADARTFWQKKTVEFFVIYGVSARRREGG